MTRYLITKKKDNVIMFEVAFYDKKIEKAMMKNLIKDKRINVVIKSDEKN
ncbi:MAG: hypothetical protein IJY87_04610 [Bacilli bacterium]|nr:hypothetical protein [Bacilli bacterium]